MIITDTKLSAKGGEITLTGSEGECFTISFADAKRLKLSALSEDDFPVEFADEELLEFLSQKLKAVKYCSYLLSFSDKSERVLKRKMREKEYSPEVIDEALQVLRLGGITDDRELCLRKYISIANSKLYGPYRIKSELFAKGFSSQDIKYAEENCDVDFEENIKELFLRLNRMEKLDLSDKAVVSKLASKLVRYGYSSYHIKLVTGNHNEIIFDTECDEL